MILRKNTDILENKGKLLIGAYMLFSFLYIAISFYESFKLNYAQQNYERGAQFAYAQVIEGAQQWCEAFSVNLWETRVDLVNVACLQPSQDQIQQQAPLQQIDSIAE